MRLDLGEIETSRKSETFREIEKNRITKLDPRVPTTRNLPKTFNTWGELKPEGNDASICFPERGFVLHRYIFTTKQFNKKISKTLNFEVSLLH